MKSSSLFPLHSVVTSPWAYIVLSLLLFLWHASRLIVVVVAYEQLCVNLNVHTCRIIFNYQRPEYLGRENTSNIFIDVRIKYLGLYYECQLLNDLFAFLQLVV